MNRPAWREPTELVESTPLTFWQRYEELFSLVAFILFLGFCVYGLPALLVGIDVKVCPTIDHHVRCDR